MKIKSYYSFLVLYNMKDKNNTFVVGDGFGDSIESRVFYVLLQGLYHRATLPSTLGSPF